MDELGEVNEADVGNNNYYDCGLPGDEVSLEREELHKEGNHVTMGVDEVVDDAVQSNLIECNEESDLAKCVEELDCQENLPILELEHEVEHVEKSSEEILPTFELEPFDRSLHVSNSPFDNTEVEQRGREGIVDKEGNHKEKFSSKKYRDLEDVEEDIEEDWFSNLLETDKKRSKKASKKIKSQRLKAQKSKKL